MTNLSGQIAFKISINTTFYTCFIFYHFRIMGNSTVLKLLLRINLSI